MTKTQNLHTPYRRRLMQLSVLFGALVVLGFFVSLQFPPKHVSAQGAAFPITGYAWSDTVGWIDLHCQNSNSCGTRNFGLDIDNGGNISGFAWSEHIGWVSAEHSDVSGCPGGGSCFPKIVGGEMRGWLRALAGGTAGSGGWDGWISLSGSNYGVTQVSSLFSGYAWGSDVVGWVDFSLAKTTYKECQMAFFCTDNDVYRRDQFCAETFIESCIWQCADGACVPPPLPSGEFRAAPPLVQQGQTTRLFWDIENADPCTLSGNGEEENVPAEAPPNGHQTGPIFEEVTFTLSCTGIGGTEEFSTVVRVVPIWQEF